MEAQVTGQTDAQGVVEIVPVTFSKTGIGGVRVVFVDTGDCLNKMRGRPGLIEGIAADLLARPSLPRPDTSTGSCVGCHPGLARTL